MTSRIPSAALLAFAPLLLGGCLELEPRGDWNNPFDPQGTEFHPPLIGLRDTAIRDADSGLLHAGATGSVRTIVGYEWIVDGIRQEARDSVLPTAGWGLENHAVELRVTDGIGLSSSKVVQVWIGNRHPSLTQIQDFRAGSGASVRKDLVAEDPDGYVVSVAWDTVPNRYSIASNVLDVAPPPGGGSRTIYWRAVDNEGGVSATSFDVAFIPAATLEMRPKTFGYATGSSFESKWSWSIWFPSGGVFGLTLTAEIPGYPDEPLTVSVRSAAGPLSCVRVAHSPDNPPWEYKCTEPAATTWSNSQIVATSTNRFGNVSQIEMYVQLKRSN